MARHLIIKTFRHLIGGIVRLALRNGLTFKEFSHLCKVEYVDVAARDYGIKGRPTNMSRIELMTGLNRREIKQIKAIIESDEEIINLKSPDKISKILSGWYEDKLYLDRNGNPLELTVDGDAPSFASLVKTYGGDIAVVTILRELRRSSTVIETANNQLKVTARYYIPNYQQNQDQAPEFVNPDAIAHGSSLLVDHINTIFHNLYRDDKKDRERFEIRATNTAIEKSKVDDFYQLIDDEGMKFLVAIDQWLDQHQVDDLSIPHERLGVGLYFIRGKNKIVFNNNN